MSLLFLNFLILLLFSPFAFSKNALLKNGLFALLILCIIFLSVFQTSSPDLDNYKLIYYGKYFRHIEPVYMDIVSFFRFIGLNFYPFWAVQAFFLSLLFYRLVVMYADDRLLTSLLFINSYFISKQLIQTRNFFSILILLFMVRFVIERKYKVACLLYGLSSGIHYSTLLFAPLFFAHNKKFEKLFFFIVMISPIFLVYPLINLLSTISALQISDKYVAAYYIAQLNTESDLGRSVFQIARGFFLLVSIFLTIKKYDSKDKGLAFLVLEGLFFKFAFSSIGHLASRLSEVFLFAEVLLLPNITKYIQNKTLYKAILVAYSFFLLISSKNTYPQFFENFTLFDYR
ncbi:MAG: EpsG family protein [Treponema sp.]|nr:EpsG family protein [Treponema sp.]